MVPDFINCWIIDEILRDSSAKLLPTPAAIVDYHDYFKLEFFPSSIFLLWFSSFLMSASKTFLYHTIPEKPLYNLHKNFYSHEEEEKTIHSYLTQ